MYTTVTVDQVIKVEKQQLSCDLCEGIIKDGDTIISIEPVVTRDSGGRWRTGDHTMSSRPTRLDVCSTECLTKNVGSASLILNTKLLPELRQNHAASVASSKEFTLSKPGYVSSGYVSSSIGPMTGRIPSSSSYGVEVKASI